MPAAVFINQHRRRVDRASRIHVKWIILFYTILDVVADVEMIGKSFVHAARLQLLFCKMLCQAKHNFMEKNLGTIYGVYQVTNLT